MAAGAGNAKKVRTQVSTLLVQPLQGLHLASARCEEERKKSEAKPKKKKKMKTHLHT